MMLRQGQQAVTSYSRDVIDRIILVAFHGTTVANGLKLCTLLAPRAKVHIAGFVILPEAKSLSEGTANAGRMRRSLSALRGPGGIKLTTSVHVCHDPLEHLSTLVARRRSSLVVVDCTEYPSLDDPIIQRVMEAPPADIALLHGEPQVDSPKLLVPVRGGPYAELALRLALSIHRSSHGMLTVMSIRPPSEDSTNSNQSEENAAFASIEHILESIPEAVTTSVVTSDIPTAIVNESHAQDLVFLGFSGPQTERASECGTVAHAVFKRAKTPVVVVKSRQPLPETFNSETAGQRTISLLVDGWFAQNTFHAAEFSDLDALLKLKHKRGETISVALPTLNEEATVGHVIGSIKELLVDRFPIVDEIVLIDSNSSDRTREIAEELGIPVYVHQKILPAYGARSGKGEALWKSLYLTRGDILVWVDTDISNFDPRFVLGQIGALLANPNLRFVKGFYRRPLRVGEKLQAGGGGRVTELMARPLINLFFPELSGVIQPLSGEYGGRRSLLQRLPFYSGYGVEVGLLIDALYNCGLGAIAQVDLVERIHNNQDLSSLSKMAFLILQAVMDKVSTYKGVTVVEEFNRSLKTIQYTPGHLFLSVDEVAERVRPPMMEIPEYALRRQTNSTHLASSRSNGLER